MKIEFLKDLSGTTPEFPAPREVDRELYKGEEKLEQARTKFPAPPEVNRFLYLNLQLSRLMMRGKGFRPLARWIGSYTKYGTDRYTCFGVSGPSRGK